MGEAMRRGAVRRFGRSSVAIMCALVCLAAAPFALSAARAASNVVQYTFDAAGNIVAMRRGDPAAFGVSGFAPSSGPAGTVVTISGNGLLPAGAGAAVAFNGATGTVLAATSTAITAIVPTGATTGRISVTTAGKTAVSTPGALASNATAGGQPTNSA